MSPMITRRCAGQKVPKQCIQYVVVTCRQPGASHLSFILNYLKAALIHRALLAVALLLLG